MAPVQGMEKVVRSGEFATPTMKKGFVLLFSGGARNQGPSHPILAHSRRIILLLHHLNGGTTSVSSTCGEIHVRF
ncbi:hypothetical protein GOBAR_DD33765 [Gossypium barbadense]|nr:hypothetical protein GOBAR_DD33765 [Gossypium barbadense]